MVKFVDEHGNKKAKCNICQKVLAADPTLNGMSTCKKHALKCIAKRDARNGQTTLIMRKSSTVRGEATPDAWQFSQVAIRLALAEMIIVDELPFTFVEHRGFIRFMEVCCLEFDIPSRRAIREDCFKLFIAERQKLKDYLRTACAGRVSITTDTWTSVQNLNYMCITAHFIGHDWKLHKRIISFSRITSHKGSDIGAGIARCLDEWGLKRLFTVTVDNASANDSAIKYLHGKLHGWGTQFLSGNYLQVRCVCHIITT
ncbi:Putative AC transposase [Linum perenne]